jgi:hypothetical protein
MKLYPQCFRFNSGKHIFFRISEENEKDSSEVSEDGRRVI